MKISVWLVGLLLVLVGGMVAQVGAQARGTASAVGTAGGIGEAVRGYEAHTEPSQRSRMNFAAGGVVAEVLVKEGDAVRRGQPLIRLDDRADRFVLEALELEGRSDLRIRAAQADLDQKRVELERKVVALPEGGASRLEVEEARVAVLIREIQVQVEELSRRQKELEAQRQAVKVEQMTLTAPFDGVVEKVDLKVGETPEAQRSAVVLVDNSKLWVNVFLPTSVTLGLRPGDALEVRYKDVDERATGKVMFLSPVADAASQTRLVRLELENTAGLPSGLGVLVMAPDGGRSANR
ncbi:MAG: efflux RND transporter periplasmic adaptor subunit [Tepidisphaerales bacterium]